jgi:hypothetical protein
VPLYHASAHRISLQTVYSSSARSQMQSCFTCAEDAVTSEKHVGMRYHGAQMRAVKLSPTENTQIGDLYRTTGLHRLTSTLDAKTSSPIEDLVSVRLHLVATPPAGPDLHRGCCASCRPRSVTPRVSNPHDYVNNMFKRP